MLGNRNKLPIRATRLVGKPYAAPSPPRLRSVTGSIKDGRQAKGTGAVFGQDGERTVTNSDGDLHYLSKVDHEAATAVDQVDQGFTAPIDNARKAGEDARLQGEDAGRELVELEEGDAVMAEEEETYKDRRGLGILGYVSVLFLLYWVALPFDKAAANGLPLSPGMQLLIALTIGGLMLVDAHYAAHKQEDFEAAREQREEHPEKFRTERVKYYGVFGGSIATILGIGAWRFFTFQAEAAATGGLFAGSAVASIVLTLLALVAFVAAFLAAEKYLWLKPLREIRRRRAANYELRKVQQRIIDTAERVQAQAQLTLDYLEQTRAKYLSQIESSRKTRRDSFMHKARTQEHKTRQKRAKQEGDDPDPGSREPVTPTGPGPRGGEARLRALDTGDLADEVRARARAAGVN
jgi:hypothetical protein